MKRLLTNLLKTLGYVFKYAGLAFIAVSALSAVLLLVLVLFPSAVINTTSVTLIKDHLLPENVVEWGEIDVRASRVKGLSLRLEVKSEAFCTYLSNVSFCARALEAATTFDLQRFRISQLGPLRVSAGELVIDLDDNDVQAIGSDEDQEEGVSIAHWFDATSILARINLTTTDLEFSRITVRKGDLTSYPEFKANASFAPEGSDGNLGIFNLNVDELTTTSEQALNQAKVEMSLTSKGYLQALLAVATWKIDDLGQGSLTLEGNSTVEEPDTYRLELTAALEANATPLGNLQANLSGSISPELFSGRLEMQAEPDHDYLNHIELSSCHFDFVGEWNSFIPKMLDYRCQTAVRLHNLGQQIAERALPKFSAQIIGNLDLVALQDSGAFTNTLDIALQPWDMDQFFYLSGGVRIISNLSPKRPSDPLEHEVILDLNAKVAPFANFVRVLENSPWAIPAPLNQLDGEVNCSLSGHLQYRVNESLFPSSCYLELASGEQAMGIESHAKVSLIQDDTKEESIMRVFLDVTAIIHSLEVVLPDLHLRDGLPQLTMDERFTSETATKAAAAKNENEQNALSYAVSLRTKSPGAILIHTNLLNQPVPLSLDFTFQSDTLPKGKLKVETHDMNLLRREILVESITISFDEEIAELSGALSFTTSGYDITLQLFGPVDEPQYRFVSQPPLSQREILALLVFGRSPAELGVDEVQSLAETQAAFADGAIGLLSMYYLAGTPIESVGYNPQTKMLSARVRLQDDLSLTVGRDFEDRSEIALRRRLSPNWSVETRAVSDEQVGGRKAVAMLRWGLRY